MSALSHDLFYMFCMICLAELALSSARQLKNKYRSDFIFHRSVVERFQLLTLYNTAQTCDITDTCQNEMNLSWVTTTIAFVE